MSRQVRQRFPPPPGWSSKHERLRDAFGNPTGPALVQGDRNMAATKEVRGQAAVDAALSGGIARDALLDPQPTDIIPDLEEKGYHVGEVAQPAEPVLRGRGDVEFESLPEAPESKFRGTLTYAEQVKANDEWQRSQGDLYEGNVHVPVETDPERSAALEEQMRGTRASGSPRSRSTGSGAAEKLDDDSAKVARAQAAEDRKG